MIQAVAALLALACLLALAAAMAIDPLACAKPYLRSIAPDEAFSLTVCRRPMLFAMPGQGSDAPGWAVLRDAGEHVGNVVDVDMVGGIGIAPRWSGWSVELPLVAFMDLPPPDRPAWLRWAVDKTWRLRAWLGLVPSSRQFR